VLVLSVLARQLVVHVYFQKIDLIQARNSYIKRIVPRCQRSSKKLEKQEPPRSRGFTGALPCCRLMAVPLLLLPPPLLLLLAPVAVSA
jgi:hypothetical protein